LDAATANVFLYGDLAASSKLLKGASGLSVGPAVIGRLVG